MSPINTTNQNPNEPENDNHSFSSQHALFVKIVKYTKEDETTHNEDSLNMPPKSRKNDDVLEIPEQKKTNIERNGDIITIEMDDYPEGIQVIEFTLDAFSRLVQWGIKTLNDGDTSRLEAI